MPSGVPQVTVSHQNVKERVKKKAKVRTLIFPACGAMVGFFFLSFLQVRVLFAVIV